MGLITVREKSVYHIHIPRCGGKYVNELFLMNSIPPTLCNDYIYPDLNEYTLAESNDESIYQIISNTYKGIHIRNLHYPLYNELSDDVKKAPKFAVVRDPYDRFISELACFCCDTEHAYNLQRVLKEIEDKDYFTFFIDTVKSYVAYKNNYFRPQTEFIDKKTKIYKLEDGLSEKFLTWFKDNFEIELVDKYPDGSELFDYNMLLNDYEVYKKEVLPQMEINPIIKEYVKEYYAKDYKELGY